MTEPDSDKTHWIVGAVKTVGVPTVFLGILLYMIYSSGRWAGVEVVMPMFKKQAEFIDRTATVVEEIKDAVVDDTGERNEILKQAAANHKELEVNRELIRSSSEEQTILLKEIADNTKPKP